MHSVKDKIRKEIIKARKVLTKDEENLAQQIFTERFTTFLESLIPADKIIGIYFPRNSELNLLSFFSKIPNQFALPRINTKDNSLSFHQWKFDDELTSNKRYKNLMEPKSDATEVIPDIVFAPLIGCDVEGNRIGSGKGMYDRTIKKLRFLKPSLLYIAICYDFQLIDEIPAEAHDQKLDIILTEKRFLDFRN
jgi:5-formyltetrahydrofolate cyclo-ligase